MSYSSFFWYDMVSEDAVATREFMVGLFGWTTFNDTMPDGTPYTSFSTAGNLVCGLIPLTPKRDFERGQAYWMSYLQVDSLPFAQGQVERHGGLVIGQPQPVPDVGSYQVIRDPAGALLAFIEAQQTILGHNFAWHTVVWNELSCPGGDTIKGFYRSVVNWTHMSNQVDEFDYGIFTKQGENMAGLLELPDAAFEAMRPAWQIYFAVRDLDAMAAKVIKFGGHLVAEPFDLPGVGRMAVVIDPGNCPFSLLQPLGS